MKTTEEEEKIINNNEKLLKEKKKKIINIRDIGLFFYVISIYFGLPETASLIGDTINNRIHDNNIILLYSITVSSLIIGSIFLIISYIMYDNYLNIDLDEL